MGTKSTAIGRMAFLLGLTLTAHSHAQSGLWTGVAPLTTGRAGVQAEAVGGFVYAIGGVDGSGTALGTEAFDASAGTWAPKASLQPPPGSGGQRHAFATAVVNGTIYAFGGATAASSLTMCRPTIRRPTRGAYETRCRRRAPMQWPRR